MATKRAGRALDTRDAREALSEILRIGGVLAAMGTEAIPIFARFDQARGQFVETDAFVEPESDDIESE